MSALPTYMTGDSCPRCTLTTPDPADHRLDRRYPRRPATVPWLRYSGPLNDLPAERSCPVYGFTQRWTGARWETILESRYVAAIPAPAWSSTNRLSRPAERLVNRRAA
ncbi:MAG: hypothetical protein AB1609_11590 [Bacillota bacterium]